jgi:altered-inheritance-of-mitochondria protein 13
MGASQSKADNEQVFYNRVPIQVDTFNQRAYTAHTRTIPQVSPELVSQLSDATLSPDVSPARQAVLDASVCAKISAEAARLHEGDDVLRREIEAALERENLDRERSMAGDADEHGNVKNSTALLGDLEEVRQKVDRYRARASLADHPDVKKASEAVASCYQCVSFCLPCYEHLGDVLSNRANSTTTLNCWSEVAAFRGAVARLEQVVPNNFLTATEMLI